MKIAVTSVGSDMNSQVDPRFGRAAFFFIIETETMAFEIVANDNVAAGGAGINSAKVVIDTGVQAVLTGNCGPNAERTLKAANIALYTGTQGTVTEAVEQFKAGALTEAAGPNVASHSGTGQ